MGDAPRDRFKLLLPVGGKLAFSLSVLLHGSAIAAAGIVASQPALYPPQHHSSASRILTVAVDTAPPIEAPPPDCAPTATPPPLPRPLPKPHAHDTRPIASTAMLAPAPVAATGATRGPEELTSPEGTEPGAGPEANGASFAAAQSVPAPASSPPPAARPTQAQLHAWMADYGAQVYRRLAGSVAYPEQAARLRREGIVTLQIAVDSAGRIVRAEAIQGDPILAAGAVQAARRAPPCPPPPRPLIEAVGPILPFRIPLRFFLTSSSK